jgi:hypothetical protein
MQEISPLGSPPTDDGGKKRLFLQQITLATHRAKWEFQSTLTLNFAAQSADQYLKPTPV